MAITLTEAAKFTTNMVRKGVLEEIIKDSVILQKLPFIDVVGNAYQYLRENVLPTGSFFDPNEVWTEDTPTWTQVTAVIKIMGGDADVDNFLRQTRSNYTDFEAETIQSKAKAVKHMFLDAFWYGDTAVNPKGFDGIHKLITPLTVQQVHQGSGSTGAPLSLANLDLAYDLVLDGAPSCMIGNKTIRRRLSQYLRDKVNIEWDRDELGMPFMYWNGVHYYADDFLTQTETITTSAYSAKTGGATSSIFFLRFGSQDVLGLQNGGLQTIKIGQLESKDARRTRIRWYPGLALMRTIGVARVDGITNAAVVA